MNKTKIIFKLSVVLFISLLAIASIGFCGENEKLLPKSEDSLYEDISLFADVITLIRQQYVEDTDVKELIKGALKGMTSSLDPYSDFLDKESYNEILIETEGEFGGIGIEVTVKDGFPTVITPIEGTPAFKAGIKTNDKIVKINDEVIEGTQLDGVVKKLRGKPGTSVRLTVLREKGDKFQVLKFELTREIIKIKSIKEAKIICDKIGYIKLSDFKEKTAKELSVSLEDLKKEGMNQLILDIRNNPGGLLVSAVEVADLFLPVGMEIVSTKGRVANQNINFSATDNGVFQTGDLIILVNEGSASAAEIVAGALKDNKRAIIVGIKTFGKGSVQTVIPLSDGSALRLTTAEYFTPSHISIRNNGIQPHIVCELQEVNEDELKKDSKIVSNEIIEELKNKTLPDELSRTTIATTATRWESDSQIKRSVEVLRDIRIYKELFNEQNKK